MKRFLVYSQNKRIIARHNQLFNAGLVSFSLAENEYSDLSHKEFSEYLNGFNNSVNPLNKGSTFIEPANVQVPESIDWRTSGAVTGVKNQRHCGSCWSFSATGSLEGQLFRKKGRLPSLSEQNLVDCTLYGTYGNHGCHGGWMTTAYQYIKDNEGVDTEDSYPYEGVDNVCRFKRENVGGSDTGFVELPEGDEEALKKAVATIGPISVAMDAKHSSFHHYREGVYTEEECSSTRLTHAVLVVGYGTDEQNQDYWLIKNSWGETWGDQGYFKIARNKENMCGIASKGSYPLV